MSDDGVNIRRATTLDVDALHTLFDRSRGSEEFDEKVERYRERLARVIENPTHHVLVAESGDELLGYTAAQDYGPALDRDWSIARMHDLWVSPEARGRGAGSALFAGIADWARRETSIRVLEWQGSPVAVDFYRRLGLERTTAGGREPHYELEVHLPGEGA